MDFEQLDREALLRYNRRLEKFGVSARTLGWDSEASQQVRFAQTRRLVDFAHKSVLDLGCGFADLWSHFKGAQIPLASYTGMDINARFLEEAKRRHPEGDFIPGNFVTSPPAAVFDAVVMLGLLNFRVDDNWALARTMIAQAFALCREVLVLDALSACLAPEYAPEAHVFYYDPAGMAALISELTPDWTLLHDYPAIPQREMMLALRRKPASD